MTDYNDGEWHGWNGGECPVHPKSVGDATYHEGVRHFGSELGWFDWSRPFLFRVVTPYIEPQEYSGECWAYHFTCMAPSLVENELSETIKGRWTATHVNGKLARITWEAAE